MSESIENRRLTFSHPLPEKVDAFDSLTSHARARSTLVVVHRET